MAFSYQISVDDIFNARNDKGDTLNNPYTFVVKSYQRGYRWESVHINHLIDDLQVFQQVVNENGKTVNKKYCLQPIITKEVDSSKNEWELVDGQQRTISLWLMRRVCFWLRDDPDDVDDLFYKFQFENKPQLQKLVDKISEITKTPENPLAFIKKIKDESEEDSLYKLFEVEKGRNIDVDCMIECIRSILLYPKVRNVLESIFVSNDPNVSPKSNSILLIWYQLQKDSNSDFDDDAITVFSNINANKIKLTESELIKAQLLYNLRGMQQKDEEEARIAFRWEEIERMLCDDSFWYFLNAGDGKETGTRIDFLFDIWSKNSDANDGSVRKSNSSEEWNKSDYPLSDSIEYTLKYSSDKAKTALAIWSRICNLVDTLSDWKNDYYFYHMIGLIVSVNKLSNSKLTASDVINNCYSEYRNVPSKEEFKKYLRTEIRKQMCKALKLKVDELDSKEKLSDEIDELSYEEKDAVKIILLIHNVASLINAQNEHERFPFELFFSYRYDIEHVNPQSPDEENEEALRAWYKAMNIKYDSQKGTAQLLLDAKIIAESKKIHSIGNLVLLDEGTNRSYKNNAFFEKRNEIINVIRTGKRESESESGTEKYIPIGTKWVFLKAFSDLKDTEAASIKLIWDGEEEYKKDIVKQLWILQAEN